MPNPFSPVIPRPDLVRAARRLLAGNRPRVRMERTMTRGGVVDGVWWPRSSDLRAELPGLVTTLAARLGPVVAVGVDSDAWEDVPARIVVDGRVVRITAYAVSDGTMTVVRGPLDHFLLLVLPPPASTAGVGTAMAVAVRTGSAVPVAADLLDRATRVPSPEGAETDGENEGGLCALTSDKG